MNHTDILLLYTQMQDDILDLQIRYYEPNKNYTPPNKFAELDLKSFCVLCHATFEEFAEKLGSELLQEIVRQFNNYRKFSIGMLSLLHFSESSDSPESIIQTPFDYLRTKLDNANRTHSRTIYNNHGVSEEYLKKIFWPLGIEIPSDPKLMGSLNKLKKHRGEFAHHSPCQITRALNPTDIEIEILDVCELMGILTKSVCRMMFYPWRQC